MRLISVQFSVYLFSEQKLIIMVLNVNGEKHEVLVEPDVELLSVLRNELDLTGSKYGCGERRLRRLYGAN